MNDEAPELVAEQVFVPEGQAVTVSNASVYVVDLDTKPRDLVMTVVTPPTHGKAKRKNMCVSCYISQKIRVGRSLLFFFIFNYFP